MSPRIQYQQRQSAHRFRLGRILAAAGLISATASSGCGISSPSDNPPPPSGGQAYVLDYNVFATQIDSMLTERGCDNLSCHGGGIRGTFQLSPSNDKDVALDFVQVSLQVNPNAPEDSPILVKPLAEAAGGVAHTADSAQFGFLSVDDPIYQAVLAWIEAGESR